MSSLYKAQLNEWKATLDVKANVCFDIGGAQDPLKGKTKSWEVKEYKIVDLEVPHVETVKPDIAQDMNEGLQGKAWQYKGKVDLVFMLGVMDYVIRPDVAMKNVKHLLTKNGRAWIEFPFVYATHEPVMQEGCRYSEGCVTRLAEYAGLEITQMIRKMAGNRHLIDFYAHDGQRMAKSYPYHGVTGFIVEFKR